MPPPALYDGSMGEIAAGSARITHSPHPIIVEFGEFDATAPCERLVFIAISRAKNIMKFFLGRGNRLLLHVNALKEHLVAPLEGRRAEIGRGTKDMELNDQ